MRKLKASYTIEAVVYVPIILFMLFGALEMGIDCWKDSKTKEDSKLLQELDVVNEFYWYQILDEVGKEIENGKS